MIFYSNTSTCVCVWRGCHNRDKAERKCQPERQQQLLSEGGVSCQVWPKAPFLMPIKAPEWHEEPRTRIICHIYAGIIGDVQPSPFFSSQPLVLGDGEITFSPAETHLRRTLNPFLFHLWRGKKIKCCWEFWLHRSKSRHLHRCLHLWAARQHNI